MFERLKKQKETGAEVVINKKIEIKNAFLLNPFFAYSAFWCIAIIVYYLSPSKLNTSLSGGLLAFLIVTIIVSGAGAVWFNKKFKGRTFFLNYRRASFILLALLCLSYIAEFVYCRDIPLLSGFTGTEAAYLDFGIPTFHVIVITLSVFYSAYNALMFFQFKKANNLAAAAVPAAYFLLIFSRGLLMFLLIVIVLLFVFDKRLRILHYVCLALLAVISMWLFGVLGNLRSGYPWNDSGLIMGSASIDGNAYSLLSPFYWVEEYLVSSLRNLNYNVTGAAANYDIKQLIYCILPDFVAKRVFPSVEYSIILAVENLTTSTAYIYGYLAFGYAGMAVSFIMFMLIALFFCLTRQLGAEYKVISLSILFFLYAMTIFDNMPFYSGYSFSLAFVCCASLADKKLRKSKIPDCEENYKLKVSTENRRRLKIAAVVVLYNPSEKQIENLKSYIGLFGKVYAADNSDNGFTLPQELRGEVSYIRMGGNRGIACALKTACGRARDDGFDLLLTMDQDSVFPAEECENILGDLESLDLSGVGLVCLNTTEFESQFKDKPDVFAVETWITSGSFIVLENYFRTAGFDGELFIDLVDFDLCRKFKQAGYKVLVLKNRVIIHAIGERQKKRLLFLKVTFSDHSPIRYYYRYRNDYYLYKRDREFFRVIHRDAIKHFVKMLLVGSDRRKKVKMVRRGIKDAKKGVLGKYRDGE